MLFFFDAFPIDQLKMKHSKKLKEILIRKPARKSPHVCLYTSETHWQFTGILPIYNGIHAESKYLNIVTSVEIFRSRFSSVFSLAHFLLIQ